MDQPSCPATPRELVGVLREFAAGQETAAGLDADPADCAADLVTLAESLAVITAALAAAMVRYDRLDAGSPAAILVRDGHLTRSEADNLRKLGQRLDTDLPATRAKLAAGQIGVAQAKTIAALDRKLADSPSSPSPVPVEARRRVEAVLAEDAVAATTTETAHAAVTARYRLDPESIEHEIRVQRDERGITVARALDGTRHINGLLDPPTAAVWETYLNRMAGPASPDDKRTAAARRVDAITDAFELLQRVTATPADKALQESCNTQPATSRTPGTPGTPGGGGSGGGASGGLGLRESCTLRPAGKPYQRPPTAQTGEDPATAGPGTGSHGGNPHPPTS